MWTSPVRLVLEQPPRRYNTRRLAPCGTPAAYYRHLRHGEVPDEECLAALRALHNRRNSRTACVRGLGWPALREVLPP